MDPFSAMVGGLQIVGQCGQVMLSLAKYINQVVTVDIRIQSFYDNVAKLQTTYEALEQCRSSPQMIAAAKAADDVTEHLWSHLAATLRDCENTLVAINHILLKINKPLGLSAHLRQIVEKPVKQLQEQLYAGELGRHHEKIKMFNTSLALPMQMINITLQLNQRDVSEEHQRRLEKRLMAMQGTIDTLNNSIVDLRQPQPLKRINSSNSATLVNVSEQEHTVCENMETFAKRAKLFLSSASSAASTRSGASTINPSFTIRATSEAGIPLTQRDRKRINAWVPVVQEDATTSVGDYEATPSPETEYDANDTDEEDFELDAVRKYFEHGQNDLGKDDFAAAEENFAEALEVMNSNEFGDRLAFQSADVVLMLTHCYVEQDKFDAAINLLLPLTETDGINDDESNDGTKVNSNSSNNNLPTLKSRKRPDHGRVLAAHHSLGNVYLKKKDYENAEKYGLSAFKGRRRFFGRDHEKTIESVQLVVDVYSTKGERAKARMYSTHLVPATESSRQPPEHKRRSLSMINPTNNPISTSGHRLSLNAQTILTLPSPPLPTTTPSKPPPNETTTPSSHISNSLPASTTNSSSSISSTTKPSLPLQRTNSLAPRHYLKPRFDSIKHTAATSKDKACTATLHLLKGYDPDPSRILTHRWDDIKRNIRKQGSTKGLAATGHGYAPIHFFCVQKEETLAEVELLIEAGVDLMAVRYRAGFLTEEPMTPLQLAIVKGHANIALAVIEGLGVARVAVGEIMALSDPDGLSPLLAACRRGMGEVVSRLVGMGATTLSTFSFPEGWCGDSMLHDACSRCDVDMVGLLLDLSSRRSGGGGVASQNGDRNVGSVMQRDQFGRTPLVYAVLSKNIPDLTLRVKKVQCRYYTVQLLLRHAMVVLQVDVAALIAVVDQSGMDALAYARDEGDERLCELLSEFAGDEKGWI